MRKLINEELIVPVFIDRDKDLQAYYFCVETLAKEPVAVPYNPYPPGPQPGQYQPPPGQYGYPQAGYGYPPQQPQPGYPSAPQQPMGYPPMPAQQQYPTAYPQNPAYPAYPPNPGYYPPQPNQYAPQPGYDPYGQYPQAPQPGWGVYQQPYAGYGQPPQQAYQPYYGSQQPNAAAAPVQDYVTEQHRSAEHSSYSEGGNTAASAPPSDTRTQPTPLGFGWNEMLFSDNFVGNTNNYSERPSTYDSYYAGMSPVEESVSVSKASTGHVNDYYMKQFERLNIGWNI